MPGKNIFQEIPLQCSQPPFCTPWGIYYTLMTNMFLDNTTPVSNHMLKNYTHNIHIINKTHSHGMSQKLKDRKRSILHGQLKIYCTQNDIPISQDLNNFTKNGPAPVHCSMTAPVILWNTLAAHKAADLILHRHVPIWFTNVTFQFNSTLFKVKWCQWLQAFSTHTGTSHIISITDSCKQVKWNYFV